MKDVYRRAVVNRLKTARGHLDAVLRRVDDDTYCPEVVKQLSAEQGSLERASLVGHRARREPAPTPVGELELGASGALAGEPEALLARDGALYAAVLDGEVTGIYRSDDQGARWCLCTGTGHESAPAEHRPRPQLTRLGTNWKGALMRIEQRRRRSHRWSARDSQRALRAGRDR